MDGEVVLSPVVHPPKSTAAAYNVYPFSGGGRRLPFATHDVHHSSVPQTIVRNSGTPGWNASCVRAYVGRWNTVSYDPG